MKKLKKSTVKIIAATSMCIFTLFSVFSASLAWFKLITEGLSGANAMPIQDHDGILSQITFHSLNTNYTTDSTYAFNAGTGNVRGTITMNWDTGEVEGVDDCNVTLDRYDPLNQSHPILMLFEFNRAVPANTVEIKAITESADFVGYITNANGNPLSSVIQHSSLYFTSAPTLTNGTYQFAKSLLSEPDHFSNIAFDDEGYPIVD